MDTLSQHFQNILNELELPEDVKNREAVKNTHIRAANAIRELTAGYRESLKEIVNVGVFDYEGDGTVTVRDVTFSSICEHHLLPFWGSVCITYKPDGRILGLSKFARVIDMYSRRLQVQERLTSEIAEAIMLCVAPKQVTVHIEAIHSCVEIRGVRKRGVSTITDVTLYKNAHTGSTQQSK
ncbi:hypothetical protein ACOME3_010416 [Neoechinorhynchus agilis]